MRITEAIRGMTGRQGALLLAEQMREAYPGPIEADHLLPVELLLASCLSYIRTQVSEPEQTISNLYRLVQAGEHPDSDSYAKTALSFLMDEWEKADDAKGIRAICVEWFRLADSVSPRITKTAANVVASQMSAEELAEAVNSDNDTKLSKLKESQPFNPVYIKEKLDETIVGQDDAKTSIAMAVYNHWLAFSNGLPATCETTLIMGPTGCGKTMIALKAAELVGLPSIVVDSSQLSEDGFKGLNKDKIFTALHERASCEQRANYGVVILDEFDKLCRPRYTSKGENYGASIQSAILGMLDGIPVKSNDGQEYETRNILFILTGAFSEMESIFEQEKKESKAGIGFGINSDAEQKPSSVKDYHKYLIEYGLIPEMAGRIANITFVHELSSEDIFHALTNSASVTEGYRKMLQLSGRTLDIETTYLKALCQQGYELGLGVRGTRNLFSERLRKAVYQSFADGKKVVRLGEPSVDEG